MPEHRTTAWLLSPIELMTACALLRIAGLPHSSYVDEGKPPPEYVLASGRRALKIGRFAAPDRDGELVVEPSLAAALLSLTGEEHEAIATITGLGGGAQVAAVIGDRATTMLESVDGIQIVTEPAAAALRRLEDRLLELRLLVGLRFEGPLRAAGRATIAPDRWQAILSGRRVRRSDDPLAAAAAQAAASSGVWDGTCLRIGAAGYEGGTGSWVYDECGLMAIAVEEAPSGDGDPLLIVEAVEDPEAELRPLLDPLRDHLAQWLSA